MRKFFIFLSLILSTHVLSGCSSCQTDEILVEGTEATAFSITVTDPDGVSFEKNYSDLAQHRIIAFEFISVYDRPNEEHPQNLRNFTFFFRADGLPNGERLFDQAAGTSFNVGESAGQDYQQMAEQQIVICREVGPEGILPWSPTSYDGVIQILDDPADDRMAIFDITFTDGIESRRIQATYSFYQGTAEVDRGTGCE